jgi:hypothetical protein
MTVIDGHLGIWAGEIWLYFHWAADLIGDKLTIPPGPAQARLRKLCASGEIRAIDSETEPFCEEPEPIPPSQWRSEDVDLTISQDHCVGVSETDLYHWLEHQSAKPRPTKVGKAPLIIEHLKQLFPQGVPDPALCPRKALKADLLARDKRLGSLDDATLKSAIDAFNHSIRNDPK